MRQTSSGRGFMARHPDNTLPTPCPSLASLSPSFIGLQAMQRCGARVCSAAAQQMCYAIIDGTDMQRAKLPLTPDHNCSSDANFQPAGCFTDRVV